MKILVVDDTKTNLLLTARMLERRGHLVGTVMSGQAAIEELSREDFDLVLMDVQMPAMSGIEAARIIRNRQSPVRQHDVPILAVSANSESACSGGKAECLHAGMNGYMSKPVRAHEFIEIVERYALQPGASVRPSQGSGIGLR